MNKGNKFWMGAAGLTAAVMLPMVALGQEAAPDAVDPNEFRNRGPYVGGALGYNEVEDQTLEFAGTRTVPVTQPTVPIELPIESNSGDATDIEYKGNIFYQGVVGFKYRNGLRPEFEIGYRQNDADDVTELGTRGQPSPTEQVKITASTGMFNLWYDLFPSWRLHPYIGGGVGFARLKLHKPPTNQLTEGVALVADPNTTTPGPPVCGFEDCSGPRKGDDAVFAYQAGAGVRWDVRDDLTVGVDYRYLKTSEAEFFTFEDQQETHLDTEYEAQSLMLSVNYFFALPTPPPPPPAPEPIAVVAPLPICSDALDNDGDGLVDFPADPGCSGPEDIDETDPAICSDGKDNDGDGLIDFPGDKGCVSADDQDETDPCKTPEAGERISLRGCGTGDIIVLRGVNFEFDKSRLTVNAKTILDNVAEELNAYPEIEVELSGHTDSKGSDTYNQSLSERRVRSVKQYLVEMGIADSRMSTVGEGEVKPVADNETDEGRELNRRVELKVTAGVAAGGPAVQVPAADGSGEVVETPAEAPPADAAAP